MTITAKVIAHSASEGCPDLITLQLKYPRFIHAEFMTHRVFSRNASSSRAIPVKRLIQDVLDDCAAPIEWGSNKPGMQAGAEIRALVRNPFYPGHPADPTPEFLTPSNAWLMAQEYMIHFAEAFSDAGYHKQIVNRIFEPFQHISVVCTATDWDNFFALRDHDAAQPEIRELARVMRKAIEGSTPQQLKAGEWHKPYCTNESLDASAARCARVSYLTHDGENPDIEKDLALAERLKEERHASPFEHQAMPAAGERHANFNGWVSYRKILNL